MGFADTGTFDEALAGHRAFVQEQFVAVFGEPRAAQRCGRRRTAGDGIVDRLAAIWRGDVSAESALDALASAGFDDPASLAATLDRVRASGRYLQLPVLSRQRFDDLLPQLLGAAADGAGAGRRRADRVPAPARTARSR